MLIRGVSGSLPLSEQAGESKRVLDSLPSNVSLGIKVNQFVFSNIIHGWQSKLLYGLTWYYLFQSLWQLICCHFISASIAVVTALILAYIRRDILEKLQLYHAIIGVQEQGNALRLSNLEFKRLIYALQEKIDALNRQLEIFTAQNREYANQNEVHAKQNLEQDKRLQILSEQNREYGDHNRLLAHQLESMGQLMSWAKTEIVQAGDTNRAMTRECAKQMIEQMELAKTVLGEVQEKFTQEHQKTFEQFSQLLVDLKELSIDGLSTLNRAHNKLREAAQKLQETEGKIAIEVEKLEGLTGQVELLRQEIGRLRKVVGTIESASDTNAATANTVSRLIKWWQKKGREVA